MFDDDDDPPPASAGWVVPELARLALVLLLLNPRCFWRSLAVQPELFLMLTSAPAISERATYYVRAMVYMRVKSCVC